MYLRESKLRAEVNAWFGELFAPENVDETVAKIVAAHEQPSRHTDHERARRQLADAEALRRFQDAIAAGVDPTTMVEPINQAQANRAAAQAELNHTEPPDTVTDADVYARIDSLGVIGSALDKASPERLAELYKAVDLRATYDPAEHAADIEIHPAGWVNNAGVGGGT